MKEKVINITLLANEIKNLPICKSEKTKLISLLMQKDIKSVDVFIDDLFKKTAELSTDLLCYSLSENNFED